MTEERVRDELRLTSWKEIASYLGVSVRTAQSWEKEKGLPVRRASSSSRSRVSARARELDNWQLAMEISKPGLSADGKHFRVFLRAAAILVIGGFAVWILSVFLSSPGKPVRGVVDGETLTIVDRNGKVCWTYDYPGLNEKAYLPPQGASGIRKTLLDFVDIDFDGTEEVLFNAQTEQFQEKGVELICIEANGTERWRFRPGRALKVGDREFSSAYGAQGQLAFQAGSRPYLLVNSRHTVFYPTQLALLDPRTGRLIGEYWHPGELVGIRLHDLDNDGIEELLVGGINNPGDGIGHPAFAVLKVPFETRESPGSAGKFFGESNADEMFYALFRNPPVKREQLAHSLVFPIEVIQNQQLRLTITSPISGCFFYVLDQQLQLRNSFPSDDLVRFHLAFFRKQNSGYRLAEPDVATWARMLIFSTAPDGNRRDIWDLFESPNGWSGARVFEEIQTANAISRPD
jgi:hypothetical protein